MRRNALVYAPTPALGRSACRPASHKEVYFKVVAHLTAPHESVNKSDIVR